MSSDEGGGVDVVVEGDEIGFGENVGGFGFGGVEGEERLF